MGNDNASAALKFAVGLVVTMILIGIIVVAFSYGRKASNDSISSMSKDIASVEESRYTMYDGVTITGAEVLNLIQKFENDNIFINVTTSANSRSSLSSLSSITPGSGIYYIKSSATGEKYSTTDEATLIRNAKDTSNTAYINPSAEFYGVVNRDSSTSAIQGISFFRVEG